MTNEEPVLNDRDGRDAVYNHPSYAVASISRVSGLRRLFGSELNHDHYLALRISPAYQQVDPPMNIYPRHRPYIEVVFSEAQLGRLLGSMSVSKGVPCTLIHKDGETIPGIKAIDTKKLHKESVQKELDARVIDLKKLQATINKWRSEKHRPTMKELDNIASNLDSARHQYASSVEYAVDLFTEHMEEVVVSAKVEIESYLQHTQDWLGVSKSEPVAMLPGYKDEDDTE